MKNFSFLPIIFVLLVFSTKTVGQRADTVLVSKDSLMQKPLMLVHQARFYIDSTRQISTSDISKKVFLPLQDFSYENFDFDFFNNDFWIRFSLQNPDNQPIEALFTAGNHRKTTLYRVVDGNLRLVSSTSQELKEFERQFRYDEKYIKLQLLPQEKSEFYVKVEQQPQLYVKFEPQLVSYEWEYKDKTRAFYDEYYILLFDAFYVAMILFVAIYIFILFAFERRRYYLYYSLYLLFLVLFSLWAIEHSPYSHLIFNIFPLLKFSPNNNTYLILSNIFYYLFIQKFLELEKLSPRFNRVLNFYWKYVLVPILLIDTFVNFVLKNYEMSGQLWLFTQPLIAFFGIYGTVEIFRLKGELARYIKWGTLILLLGAMMGFYEQLFFQKPANLVIMRLAPSFAFNFGVLIEILIFTSALGFKTFLIQKEKRELLKKMKESELRTLRSQINPHFIFNSLNSIKSYILKHHTKEAAEYLTDFSTLMRSILQLSKEKLISLKDELETSILYIKLEKLRFEDNFEFVYELDETIDTEEVMIPPMLLQPYIENAIKHGLMNKEEGVRTLKLLIRRLDGQIEIIIDDNGIGRMKAEQLNKNRLKHQSMGMNINDERLNLLSITDDFNIKIEVIDKENGTKVVILLPFDEE